MLHLIACVRTESYTPIERYRDEAVLFEDIAAAYQKRSWPSTTQAAVISSWTIRPGANSVMKINAKPMPNTGFDLDRIAKEYVKVLNKVLAVKPKDMVITMHICRGNFRSTWFLPADMGPLPRPSLRTVLSMDSFSNTIRIGQGTSIRSTISRTKRLFWALLPQNRQTLKIRKPSKDGSRKQAPWFPWISWPLARMRLCFHGRRQSPHGRRRVEEAHPYPQHCP